MANYQKFTITEEEFLALEQDIRERGIQHPIEIDENGDVLDGHNRKKIAEKHGLECPTVVRKFVSEEKKREYVIMINLARRDARQQPWRWGMAFEELCKIRGVMPGQGKRNDLTSATVAEVAAELGVSDRTARERLRQWRVKKSLSKPTTRLVDDGKANVKDGARLDGLDRDEANDARKRIRDGTAKDIKEALKQQKKEREEAALAELVGDPELINRRATVKVSDVKDFADVMGSKRADVILTDPPYSEEYLPLYRQLSKVAANVLKDNGSLVVMCGQSFLPQIMQELGKDLDYHWMICYRTPGGQSTQLWDRQVNTFWKPVLWYVKKGYKYSGKWIGDVAESKVNDNDKRFHGWGQSESGIADLVKRCSEPGHLIADPFVGGGTTAVAALSRGRRFVGCDIERSCISTTLSRIERLKTDLIES